MIRGGPSWASPLALPPARRGRRRGLRPGRASCGQEPGRQPGKEAAKEGAKEAAGERSPQPSPQTGVAPDSRPLRVLIADDHVRTRRWVREALEREGIVVCGEVASAEASVDSALRERPDVCLLDVNMPGNGIKAAKEISTRLPATAVVMLTVSSIEEDISDSIRAGASGYLLKDMDPAKLADALLAVLSGQRVLPEGPGRSRS